MQSDWNQKTKKSFPLNIFVQRSNFEELILDNLVIHINLESSGSHLQTQKVQCDYE